MDESGIYLAGDQGEALLAIPGVLTEIHKELASIADSQERIAKALEGLNEYAILRYSEGR